MSTKKYLKRILKAYPLNTNNTKNMIGGDFDETDNNNNNSTNKNNDDKTDNETENDHNDHPNGGFPPIYLCDSLEINKDSSKNREYVTHKSTVSISQIMEKRRTVTPFLK
jgi:hypothetical protein